MGMRRVSASQGPGVHTYCPLPPDSASAHVFHQYLSCSVAKSWPPLCPSRLTARLVVHFRQKFTETHSMLFKPHALKQDGVSFPASPGRNKTKEWVLSLALCASCLVHLGSTLRSHKAVSVRRWVSEADLDVQMCLFIHSGTLSCPLTGPCFSVHIYI